MKAFLDKIERQAERLMGIMDGQLNQPIVQTLTGEVFTHQPNSIEIVGGEQPAAQESVSNPDTRLSEREVVNRQLKQARGSA